MPLSMWNDRERRYLTLYLPVGILAAVLIDGAAFAAIGAPFPWFEPTCAGCPSSTTPLGTALGLGAPTEQVVGGLHWYNFTVESAGGGLVAAEIQVEVLADTGAIVPPGLDWSLSLIGTGGITAAEYDFSAAAWATGGPATISSGDTLALGSGPTSLSGAGDMLEVLGQGSFDGTISVEIP